MKITLTKFRRMLAIHGADLSRWDGFSEQDIRSFMEISAEARSLFSQAQALDRALDSFAPPPVPGMMADRAMPHLGEQASIDLGNTESAAWFTGPKGWIPATAFSACAAFFMWAILTAPQPLQDVRLAQSADEDLAVFLAEVDKVIEEDIADEDLFALLQTAQNDVSGEKPADAGAAEAATDPEVERLLDEIIREDDTPASAAGAESQDVDIWDYFMEDAG